MAKLPPSLATLRRRPLTAARTFFDLAFDQFASRTRVLFVMCDAYGFACQAPVIRELQQYADVLIGVTTDRPHDPHRIEFASAEDGALFRALYLPTAQARFSKWHMVVDTHLNSFHPALNALRIFMHHGPGFGNTGNKAAIAKRYEIFCGLSEMEREWLDRLYPGVFGTNHVFFPVGFPKSDALYQRRPKRNEVLSSLNLPDRPTILITSHWQRQGILRCLSAAPLCRVAAAFPDHNIIQTGHPWLWHTSHNIPEGWRQNLLNDIRQIEERNAHVRFVQTSNAEILLSIADLLVGDSSSVMTTYSLLDRPIVFFDNPDFEFATPEFKQIFINASHSFTCIEELVHACCEALTSPQIKAQGRARMRSAFYANEGKSAAFMSDLIRRIGRVSSIYSPDWQRVVALANSHAKSGSDC